MQDQKLKFVSKEKILEMLENKKDIKLVEVLSPKNFAEGHLPNAINIPAEDIEQKADSLLPDKAQMVVVYCSSFTCTASTSVARKLQSLGYTNVLDFKGGKADWQAADLPLLK
jgi:rhodanese-related sulfurtransferase